MENDSCAVRFDHVSVARNGVQILNEVCASVPRGSCTVLIGPNGAGKTTLLLSLLGERSYTGRIVFGGGRPRMGFVPQKITMDRGMPFTVEELLSMGVQRRPLWLGLSRRSRENALDLLSMVHAQHIIRRRVGTLSGGEMQRVLLALALQRDPEMLILDEPSAGVDAEGGRLFCELLEDLRLERGFTQLMITHDLAMVAHHATHAICLNKRVVAEGEPRDVLVPSVLQALFGMHMGLICAGEHAHAAPSAPFAVHRREHHHA
ncbi:MAG: metal ABC transporter ATP-binding protein [Desulfovibrio sp.]|nr:metal ABC transporter ATP-binding protein [Mailhella sp.]